MTVYGDELIQFLLPSLGDPLQIAILGIISIAMAVTMGCTHWRANSRSWERKWARGTDTKQDDLDIEHGSVTDLWHAVATVPEKLSEVMPGMMLVVGLLGTFLGLGLALNHASNILSEANSIANSMGDLTGLLQGLGTKFKTSTWGITGYIVLKVWSEAFRFEEKRLTWVISKVKAEIERKKKDVAQVQKQQSDEFRSLIQATSTAIVGGISHALDRNAVTTIAGISKSLHEASASISTQICNALAAAHAHSQQHLNGIAAAINKHVGASIESATTHTRVNLESGIVKLDSSLGLLLTQSIETQKVISIFTVGINSIVDRLSSAAQSMTTGANSVAESANHLKMTVQDFGEKFESVLDDVQNELKSAITDTSRQAAMTLREGTDKLEAATNQIFNALYSLSSDLKETLHQVDASLSGALKDQESLLKKMTFDIERTLNTQGDMAKSIQQKIEFALTEQNHTMKLVQEKIDATVHLQIGTMKGIKDDLTKALGDSNLSVRTATDELAETAVTTSTEMRRISTLITQSLALVSESRRSALSEDRHLKEAVRGIHATITDLNSNLASLIDKLSYVYEHNISAPVTRPTHDRESEATAHDALPILTEEPQ